MVPLLEEFREPVAYFLTIQSSTDTKGGQLGIGGQ